MGISKESHLLEHAMKVAFFKHDKVWDKIFHWQIPWLYWFINIFPIKSALMIYSTIACTKWCPSWKCSHQLVFLNTRVYFPAIDKSSEFLKKWVILHLLKTCMTNKSGKSDELPRDFYVGQQCDKLTLIERPKCEEK